MAEEHKGIIRHGAKMLFGYREATVPKISCVIRKAYGGSLFAMGSKTMGSDIAFSWPTAEIAVMGAEGAVNILYRKELEAAEDKDQFRQQKIEEYRDTFSTPYWSASRQVIDAVIRPAETRPHLIVQFLFPPLTGDHLLIQHRGQSVLRITFTSIDQFPRER